MKNKLVSVLLSVAIAFGLWYYVITVISPNTTETFYDIPVVLVGETALEERGLMVTAVGNTTVDLTLTGNRSDLNQLTRENITLKANLNNIYDPGKNMPLEYTIAYPGTVPNNAFVVESKIPDMITVTVEKRLYKDIPVNVVYYGTVAEDFTAIEEEQTLDYSTIRISGPASVVEQITQAVVEVSLANRTESISDSYRYTLCDETGEPVNSELITVSVEEVELNLPIRMVKRIPLVVNVIAGGGATEKTTSIEIDPKEIQVCGSAAALEGLDEIVLGTINLADYEEATELTFDINLPDSVTNMTGLKQAKVILRFPDLSTKTISVENIQIINVPEGLEVELTTQVLEIVFRGPKAVISNLEAEDVTVTVDFTGAELGTFNKKVTITISGEFAGCGALGSYSVYATVMKPEEEAVN